MREAPYSQRCSSQTSHATCRFSSQRLQHRYLRAPRRGLSIKFYEPVGVLKLYPPVLFCQMLGGQWPGDILKILGTNQYFICSQPYSSTIRISIVDCCTFTSFKTLFTYEYIAVHPDTTHLPRIILLYRKQTTSQVHLERVYLLLFVTQEITSLNTISMFSSVSPPVRL